MAAVKLLLVVNLSFWMHTVASETDFSNKTEVMLFDIATVFFGVICSAMCAWKIISIYQHRNEKYHNSIILYDYQIHHFNWADVFSYKTHCIDNIRHIHITVLNVMLVPRYLHGTIKNTNNSTYPNHHGQKQVLVGYYFVSVSVSAYSGWPPQRLCLSISITKCCLTKRQEL